MAWQYRDLPEALRLPPCRYCGNRLRVSMILRGVFVCGDCGRPFVAVWVAEERQPLEALPTGEAR